MNVKTRRLVPSSAASWLLRQDQQIRITDPMGKQVADLVAFAADDWTEWLSSGRTFDYNRTLRMTTGHTLYSDRSRPMLVIEEDTVGRHDFLFAACSREMFARQGADPEHANCLDALVAALADFSITADRIPTPFNVFMNVDIDAATGALTIRAPVSVPGS